MLLTAYAQRCPYNGEYKIRIIITTNKMSNSTGNNHSNEMYIIQKEWHAAPSIAKYNQLPNLMCNTVACELNYDYILTYL